MYIARHCLTTSNTLSVLVMREEKCDVIVRVKIVTESSVSLSESDRLLHTQTNERPSYVVSRYRVTSHHI